MIDYMIDASVRLVCNFADLPFRADKEEELARRVTERISVALERSGDAYVYLLPSGMQDENKHKLYEERMLHLDTNTAPYSVLYLRMDEKVSVQTALSDHAAVCAYSDEGALLPCLATARQLRHQLAETGTLACDVDYGYLTAHPCDAGTGMRASLLLHLPMLHLTRQTGKMQQKMLADGAILRPASNDVSQGAGSLYLLENRSAMGKNAEEMAQALLQKAQQATEAESHCRDKAKEKGDEAVLDAVWRAYGIAQYTRRITQKDAMNLWSHLTLGVSLGAYELSEKALSGMWHAGRGTIVHKGDVPSLHPDVLRAQFIRTLINGGK